MRYSHMELRWTPWVVVLLCGCTAEIGDHPGEAGSCTQPRPLAVGSADPWRLTVREYEATVRALVGRPVDGLTADLPGDPPSEGYDNQVNSLTMTRDQTQGFALGADRVATLVTSDAALRRSLMGCDLLTGDRDACLALFIQDFGKKVYRRPLTGSPAEPSSEVGRLFALAQHARALAQASGSSPYDGLADVAAVTSALLQSPSFLFRLSVGSPEAGRRKLDGYEVATRLSYLFWGEGPDEALLAAAAAGELSDPEGLEQHARRTLADPKARAHLRNFFHQWLDLGRISLGTLDTTRFPQFTPAMQSSMYGEIQQLLEDHTFGPQPDFLGVLTASYGYSDRNLAGIYGQAQGSQLTRFEHPAGPRGGLLTTAGLLSIGSHPTEPSVVNRGLLVRRNILCGIVPPPPPNVPDLPADPTLTPAQLQNRHSADPACASCHRRIDPIGNGLDMFDAIGALNPSRTEEQTRALTRDIYGIDHSEFLGGMELGRILREQPDTRACVVENLYRWSMGRTTGLGITELSCSTLTQRFAQSTHSLTELLLALVRSDDFRFKAAVTCP